jgi:DNA-directed RNA polymerase specialized sigma24 family protein
VLQTNYEGINSHVVAIEFDAAAWLESYCAEPAVGWMALLQGYARQRMGEQSAEKEAHFKSWAARYSLDPGQNVTNFLFRVCTDTIRQLMDKDNALEQILVSQSAWVQEAEVRLRALETPSQPQTLVELVNSLPAIREGL